MKLEQSEHDIQTAIIQYLTVMGFFVWRNNSGMIAVGEGKYRRMIKMGVAGLPDVFALKGGVLYGIEVKRPKGKPTDLQLMQIQALNKHGAKAFIAHSVDEVVEKINENHLTRDDENENWK